MSEAELNDEVLVLLPAGFAAELVAAGVAGARLSEAGLPPVVEISVIGEATAAVSVRLTRDSAAAIGAALGDWLKGRREQTPTGTPRRSDAMSRVVIDVHAWDRNIAALCLHLHGSVTGSPVMLMNVDQAVRPA